LSDDKIQIGTGEDAQSCPNDCAYNLIEQKKTEEIDLTKDPWLSNPDLKACDFDGECEDREKIDGAGGEPESCPDCAECGDNVVDIGEQCDSNKFRPLLEKKIADFGGQKCEIFAGYESGNFSCDSDCKIDMSECEQKKP
jgi:hypothetical protein